ncbi:cell surface protein [Lacrimispora sp.]|uniref:cell surface protein n=1 Tax=Lacrimispora sp. TaxID=2719234 RepID=UPI0028AFEAB7|nr:cell surface protein [Lacrimispora sp.]
MKKRLCVLMIFALSVGFLMSSFHEDVYAAEGWKIENGEWSYLGSDDQPVTNVWKKSKDSWYYLSSEGTILKNCIFHLGNTSYFVDEDGKMVQNTWIWIDETKDPEGDFEEGWYYFGTDGKAYQRKGNSFKKKINGNTYLFNEDGLMLTGWFDENGNSINDSDDPFVEGVYYSGEDGILFTEKWLDYGEIGYGTGGSELLSNMTDRYYSDYEKMWIYFDESSKKVFSKGETLKQKNIGGNAYGFDENGIMNPWWGKVATISNADKSNPTSSTSARFYSAYDGGKLLKNMWFWMYPSENLDETDYFDQECSWWHTDEKGEVYRNRIRNISGKNYAFDGIGRMKTGFVLFDGKSEFVAQYDVDDWSSEDFIDGSLYGIEKSDLYLFAPDELNDGSMQIGKEIKVELEDGIFTFGFSGNGKAYGNRNKLQRKDNRYYINGLRLEADEEYGYGVVEVRNNDETYYQVVDMNGKIVKGDKKAVKDKDGGYLLIINDRFAAWVGDDEKPRWRDGVDGIGFYHYDKDNKENPYEEGLIAGYGTESYTDELPPEERLNF